MSEILRHLQDAEESLRQALPLLIQANTQCQLDYCNSPKISTTLDNILRLSNRIDKIVYQKEG
jgi:hypothetical protein